jgi:two-component system sensor histidine kinase/response regulator
VTDFGVGISEEDKSKLFTDNNYFSTTGTNNEKGSGLGLILCSEFVKKLGGNLWFDSKFGEFFTHLR